MARKRKPSLVTVFEAVNATAKEIFVGMTKDPMHELISRHRESPPVKHWLSSHEIDYRSVEFDLPVSDASQFISRYVEAIRRGKWVVHHASSPL